MTTTKTKTVAIYTKITTSPTTKTVTIPTSTTIHSDTKLKRTTELKNVKYMVSVTKNCIYSKNDYGETAIWKRWKVKTLLFGRRRQGAAQWQTRGQKAERYNKRFNQHIDVVILNTSHLDLRSSNKTISSTHGQSKRLNIKNYLQSFGNYLTASFE